LFQKELSILLLSSLFLGCGYKPSVEYQKKVLGERIKTKITIDVKNPRESIFLKDALNDAVFVFLDANVCNINCDSTIEIKKFTTTLTPLDYDVNGYPILYRSKVNLVVKVDSQKIKKNYYVSGKYDFSIEKDSILTDQQKLQSYKKATINALNRLFSQITKDGV